MDTNLRNREIRWLILQSLHEVRRAGKAQAGGWLSLLMLREIMSVQGYDLAEDELKDHCEYLIDKGCAEKKKIGEKPPYLNKYKILAKGIDVLEGQEKIAGIGISAGR